MSSEEFDQFYRVWITRSARENSMNEYGQLVFLQGQASQWNKRNFRFILLERSKV